MKTKIIISRFYLLILTLSIVSLFALDVNAAQFASLCATPSTTGIENCCDPTAQTTLCSPCLLATVCIGESIDFRHIAWPNPPLPPPPYPSRNCATTYWAIYTSCNTWTPGPLYTPMFTTPTSVFTLNTTGMPAGTYYIQAACTPIDQWGGGGSGTHIYQFVVQDCSPPGKCWCQCDEIPMWLSDFTIDEAGIASVGFHLGATIYNVDKFRITLINYHQDVAEDCKMCDLTNQEKFGDITPAPYLYGAPPLYGSYNPNFGVGYSREVTWCFETQIPKIDPLFMPIGLRFPPVRPGCRNSADFCFRVEVYTDGCKQCERLVCVSPISGQRVANPKSDATPEDVIKAIPNPAKTSFNLQTPEEDAIGDVSIYNADGSLLVQLHTKSSLTLIDTKGWSPGIYIISYKTATKSYQEKLIIDR